MAYTHPGYDPHWWQQQFYQVPYYPSIPVQDEHWMMMDFSSITHDQKQIIFQPQSSLSPEHLLIPRMRQESDWSHDFDHCARTVSPTVSQYSSSLSDSSASSDHALTPVEMSHSTPFIPHSTAFQGHHTYRLPDLSAQQHTIWQPQPHISYAMVQSQSQSQSHFASFVPSQPSLPLRDVQMVNHSEGFNLDATFEDHVDDIQPKSPTYIPQPQELEYSDEHDDSDMSTMTEDNATSTPMEQRVHVHALSDEIDEEEDEDPIAIDRDSDSDYDNRRPRRRGPRNTPKQKHPRKRSTITVISQTSRVHKRTSSAATITSTTSTSTTRSPRGRSYSKSIKHKPKGPSFLSTKIMIPIPKSERTYPCTFHRFGCKAEFPNKNEWKRHVACQHLQLGYYRCDMDGCNPDVCPSTATAPRHGRRGNSHALVRSRAPSEDKKNTDEEIVKYYNDFNRKDLFTQHCRRMHGPTRNPALCSKPPSKKNGELCPTKEDEIAFEAQLDSIRDRCWHVRRPAPSRSSCGFCQEVFDADYDNSSSTSTAGSNGKEAEGNEEKKWEERMEHVGRHYEKEGADREEEKMDEDLVEWGLSTGVLTKLPDGRPWLVNIEAPATEEQKGDVKMEHAAHLTESNRTFKPIFKSEEETSRKKARRQPSRTAVVQRRVSFKEEDDDDTTVVVHMIKNET